MGDAKDRQGDPAALAPAGGSDAVLPVTVGTAIWAVALLVATAMRDRLRAAGDGWWLWVCVTGLVLGLLGSVWVRRRRSAYRGRGEVG